MISTKTHDAGEDAVAAAATQMAIKSGARRASLSHVETEVKNTLPTAEDIAAEKAGDGEEAGEEAGEDAAEE